METLLGWGLLLLLVLSIVIIARVAGSPKESRATCGAHPRGAGSSGCCH